MLKVFSRAFEFGKNYIWVQASTSHFYMFILKQVISPGPLFASRPFLLTRLLAYLTIQTASFACFDPTHFGANSNK